LSLSLRPKPDSAFDGGERKKKTLPGEGGKIGIAEEKDRRRLINIQPQGGKGSPIRGRKKDCVPHSGKKGK